MKHSITIYSTSTCSSCHVLTQWLDKHDLAYTLKIADEDPSAMMEFMSVNDGMVSVPFTLITSEDGTDSKISKISGYDPAQIRQALGL